MVNTPYQYWRQMPSIILLLYSMMRSIDAVPTIQIIPVHLALAVLDGYSLSYVLQEATEKLTMLRIGCCDHLFDVQDSCCV